MNINPSSLRINGRTISIRYLKAERLPGCSGLFRSLKSSIEISKEQDLHETKDTVLHEALHTQGREYQGDTEEEFVRALATGLYGLFQDNPEFALWLSSSPLGESSSPIGDTTESSKSK